MLKILVIVGLLAFAAGTLFVRLAPIGGKHFAPRIANADVGVVARAGGHRVVVPAPSAEQLASLMDTIAASPRTIEVESDVHNTRMFVHRSRMWGFPDVTHVTLINDLLIIDSHLVYGQSDLGVNKARIEGWLATVNL